MSEEAKKQEFVALYDSTTTAAEICEAIDVTYGQYVRWMKNDTDFADQVNTVRHARRDFIREANEIAMARQADSGELAPSLAAKIAENDKESDLIQKTEDKTRDTPYMLTQEELEMRQKVFNDPKVRAAMRAALAIPAEIDD